MLASAKDLTPPPLSFSFGARSTHRVCARLTTLWYDTGAAHVPRLVFRMLKEGEAKGIVASSMDSGLEAFSHNPADDSFSPLAFQPGENTKYLNQRFLSY